MFLRLTALPIGNPGDLSARAKESLADADLIICEDTRKLKFLANAIGLELRAELFAVPAGRVSEVNWERWCQEHKGKRVTLVSDAGTPLINDPGQHLLEIAEKRGVEIEAIPGPCAPILAYQRTGGFGLPLIFAGFPPRKKMRSFFENHGGTGTLIYFETKHHYRESFSELVSLGWGARRVIIARELTKTHEEILRTTVERAARDLEQIQEREGGALGEMTILLELIQSASGATKVSLEDLLAIRFSAPKAAAKLMARILGGSARELYQRIVEWKK